MALREDDVAPRSRADRRTMIQAGGFALAVLATLAVFLTDNPQFLRLAVLGAAWAFVLATFAAGARATDRVAAQARETELRRAYQSELEREVAARREYELALEADLRREAEESMRAELDALRQDLAGLAGLREELGRVADLRTDVAALAELRTEVARVAALRDDVAQLTGLRQDLGQLTELRADMGRLRQELTEQLSSEMLIERIVMRTQASRLGTEPHDAPGRAIDTAARWPDDAAPQELTGGWPAVRLDDPRHTRHVEQVLRERTSRPPVPPPAPPGRPVPSPSWRPSWESEPTASWPAPATASWATVGGEPWTEPAPPPAPAPSDEDRWISSLEDRWAQAGPGRDGRDEDTPLWSASAQPAPGTSRARPGAAPVPPTTSFPMTPPSPEPLPTPLEWLAARSLIDAEPTSFRPEVPPRRRRGDEEPVHPVMAPTTQRPAVPANPRIRVDDRGGYRVAVPVEEPAAPAAQEKRLADILAENGVTPNSGGRRRRRYRDEDEPDDVLARVLGDG